MKLRKLLRLLKHRRGLLVIITAGLVLELISATQYYYSHYLMSVELEKRVESELTIKAIRTKSTLSDVEDIIASHIEYIQNDLTRSDSILGDVRRVVMNSRHIQGFFICFVPNYYPDKSRLLEIYAKKIDGEAVVGQFSEAERDYTQVDFFTEPMSRDESVWVDPYIDAWEKNYVISYSRPLHDKKDSLVGVVGADLSLSWLGDTLNYKHLYASSFFILLTEGGFPMVTPPEKIASKEISATVVNLINDSTVVRKKSRSGRSTIIECSLNGREATIFYANMKGHPRWQLVEVNYDDEVYGPLWKMRFHIVLLMLLAFGILLYMIVRFIRSEEILQKKKNEQQRINDELKIANGIQQTLLPAKEPSLTGVDDVQVEGRLIPAKAVGGDLYNAFVRDEKLFFCIGDVSGKGVPAALIMAIVQSLFRNVASHESNPAHIMNQLNEVACRNNESNFFVTMFVGVLDLPTGHLRFCNAGHEIPIIVSKRKGEGGKTAMELSLMDMKPNLPIGLFDDFHYEMQEMDMEKEMALFLYTDGLTEARDAQNKLFGRERAVKLISECNTTNPKQMVEYVIEQVTLFSQGAEQSDDLTMLALCYTPTEEKNILNEELILHNDVKEVSLLNDFMKQKCEQLSIDKHLILNLRLAVEEAVVNVMEYAYPAGTSGVINVRLKSDGHRLKIIITDSGTPFNPTEVALADTTLSAEERPVGGLGILLVRELMDSINYERINNKNVLTLSKEYTAANN